MNYEILNLELATDPLTLGYAAMADAGVAEALNEQDRTILRRASVTKYSFVDVLGLPRAGELWAKIETLAEINTEAAMALRLLDADAGIDAGKLADLLPRAKAALGITDEEIAALTTETVSRGAELGIGAVTVGHVESARLRIAEETE